MTRSTGGDAGTGMDAAFYRPQGAVLGVDDLPMFARPASVDSSSVAPDDRSPAPSVPSGASEEAAERLSVSRRRMHNAQILLVLGTLDPGDTLSRHEIHERTGISETTLCARLKLDLQPDYIEAVKRARPSHDSPTLKVLGYRLTERGRDRVRAAS